MDEIESDPEVPRQGHRKHQWAGQAAPPNLKARVKLEMWSDGRAGLYAPTGTFTSAHSRSLAVKCRRAGAW